MLKKRTGLDNDGLGDIFELWNRGELNSFWSRLLHIFCIIRRERWLFAGSYWMWPEQKERENGAMMAALDEGTVDAGVGGGVCPFHVVFGERKRERPCSTPRVRWGIWRLALPEHFRNRGGEGCLVRGELISYAGFSLMRRASERNGWNLDYGTIAKIWRKDVSFALYSWRGLLKHSRKARDYRICYLMLFPRGEWKMPCRLCGGGRGLRV